MGAGPGGGLLFRPGRRPFRGGLWSGGPSGWEPQQRKADLGGAGILGSGGSGRPAGGPLHAPAAGGRGGSGPVFDAAGPSLRRQAGDAGRDTGVSRRAGGDARPADPDGRRSAGPVRQHGQGGPGVHGGEPGGGL